jgi:hypothetical protein
MGRTVAPEPRATSYPIAVQVNWCQHLEAPADPRDLAGSPQSTQWMKLTERQVDLFASPPVTIKIHTDPQRAAYGFFKGIARLPHVIAHSDVHLGGAAKSRSHHGIYLAGRQRALRGAGAGRLAGASHGVGDRRAAHSGIESMFTPTMTSTALTPALPNSCCTRDPAPVRPR